MQDIKIIPVFALSVDLTMMFNMLSPSVSAKIAQAAGLSQSLRVDPWKVREEACAKKVAERLVRISHLPTHVALRAAVCSSTALSLLDYAPSTVKKPLQGLRAYVRRAISMKHGAPEIIYNLPTTSMLDPIDRNFLSLLTLWTLAWNDPMFSAHVTVENLKESPGRLGCVIRECKSRGIQLQPDTIVFGHHDNAPSFRLWRGWQAIRKHVIRSLKDMAFRNLQTRRPDKFAADFACGWKQMKKYWASLPSYEAATLMSIWSGSVMTASHRHTMDPTISPLCPCGQGEQTLHHLMWLCPLQNLNRPLDLNWWADLPNASSCFLILPHNQTLAFYRDWKRACKWALVVVSRRQGRDGESQEVDVPHQLNERDTTWNGHCPIVRSDLGYIWCAKCYVTRKMRDRQYLFLRPCKRHDQIPTPEGHYTTSGMHLVRIQLTQWKLSSWRPKKICMLCGGEQWATAEFRRPCQNARASHA